MNKNRNNSMVPIPGLRDNYYMNGPTPAIYNSENANKCLFENDNYKKVTSDNETNFDNNINSIGKYNFKQDEYIKNVLLDNNVKEIIKDDYNKDITVLIDTIDRNINTYPNSFDFKTIINPNNSSIEPYINKKIENVKSLYVSTVILPNYYKLERFEVDNTSLTFNIINIIQALDDINDLETDIIYTDNGIDIIIIWFKIDDNDISIDFFDTTDALTYNKVYSVKIELSTENNIIDYYYYTYQSDNPNKLDTDRFLYMEIKELKNIDNYSTNEIFGQSFGTLHVDGYHCNDKLLYMRSYSCGLSFNDSNLKDISSLTIKIYNSLGELLDMTLYKNTEVSNTTKKNLYNNNEIRYVSPSLYIRHPLYIYSQCYFIFSIKYVAHTINKLNFK